MLLLYKATLAPALLWQGSRLRRTALRLPEPEGERSGVVAGTPGDRAVRVLVIGDSSAAGVGVEHQQEALAGPIAVALAQRTGCTVHWQLAARSGLDTVQARQFLRTVPLQPADVIVSALGVNDVTSQTPPALFVRQYKQLLRDVRRRTGARIGIVSGVPPLHQLPAAPQPLRWYLGQCARRLDQELQYFCEKEGRLRYLSLHWADPREMSQDRFHPGPVQYARWAQMNAEAIARALVLPCPETTATGPSATLRTG
ncbi:MAG: SGNH/GDSL hydrolase family protein [Aquincola tertiaricarbonis]|uniref:SGNH/GDSL hydrolase family protein n=1 Tax=Aquincola sp. J276 TaxID=2898432 RepID=UPI002151C10A|nr:SGNH/GDSL hydrolase family protein [Aquincola sp. J276]MCR5865588.1 SGNH/GDSL hydrolase family protein [Aquincola sp. J276]